MSRAFRGCWALLLAAGCAPVRSAEDQVAPDWSQWEAAVSPETVTLMKERWKAIHGEAADLDGDGYRETTSFTAEDGTIRWESAPPDAVNGPEWFVERRPNGDFRRGIDVKGYGFFNVLEERTRATHSRVLWRDDDFTRKFESRRTEVLDGDLIHVTVERSEKEDGTFALISAFDLPAAANGGGAGCWGLDGFPPDLTGSFGFGASTDITIVSGSKPGQCTVEQTIRLLKAIECAIGQNSRKRGLPCLEAANSEVAKRLKSSFAEQPLLIACGNGCDHVVATTADPTIFDALNPQKSNWSGSYLASLSDDDLCTNMIHELMHWDAEERAEDHDKGYDRVYACGRYCGGCTGVGPPGFTAPGPNVDCARCAGTDVEKRKCGMKTVERTGSCPTYALCHGSIGTNLTCDSCGNLVQQACDDTDLGAPHFNCCQTCPAAAPKNTDKPCDAGIAPPPSSCNVKPGSCP